jgi:MYXO-CTERM domain-containing protein
LFALAAAISAGPASAEDPGEDCGLEDPDVARRAPPVPARANEVPGLGAGRLPAVRRVSGGGAAARISGEVGHGAAGGILSGKAVYVSAGHGFTYLPDLGWRTQRPNTNDIVEDLVSTETVSQLLVQYLVNMGAYVVPIRESDLNTGLAIVDEADGGFALEGEVASTGEATGYALPALPLVGNENPFAGGQSLVMTASSAETGRARWTFDVPADGYYVVYVGWVQDPSRASDAHYVVHHAGGEAHFRVDQRRHGGTWVRLGRFYFRAGSDPQRGSVALANDSAAPGSTLSADVARIGGGMTVHDRGGGVSGRPMFETNARYNVQLLGAPASVYSYTSSDRNDDVGARSRFTAWEHEAGEDAVYVAWHTNAPNPGRGTSTYTYGNGGGQGGFTGVAGSLELQNALHSELVADLRAVWEAGWPDGGKQTANFGEVNPTHNPETPSVLVEVAFHDTPADAAALSDPRFRRVAARALAQGIARYFAAKDGIELVLPPEPPIAARAAAVDGAVEIAWRPADADLAGGDAATGYRVYLSRDGLAFDDGRAVDGQSIIVDDLEPGEVTYARVTATNGGGESLPSGVVGARLTSSAPARVLVVNGFERIDAGMMLRDDLSSFALGSVGRALHRQMNDGSYVARHGDAIAANRISFDSASSIAVLAGDVDLGDYDLIDWFVGEDSVADRPLDARERELIAEYLGGGGDLLVSGSEIGYALVERGEPAEADFVSGVLGLEYVGDDAGGYTVFGAGRFAALGELSFADTGPGGYDCDYPDIWAPAPGAEEVFAYPDGIGAAGVLYTTPSGGRALTLGFPLETVVAADVRADLMAAILETMEIEAEPEPEEEELAGCGCRAGSPASGNGLLVLLAAALLWRRRN